MALTTYDKENNTIIRIARFETVLARIGQQAHDTKEAMLSVLKSASRDIEAATRRYWIPNLVTVTYDAPPGSLLSLSDGRMCNEILLNQPSGGPWVTAYGSPLTLNTNFRYRYNPQGTAVDCLEFMVAGVTTAWDTGHRLDGTYRGGITVRGIRAAAVDVPEQIAQACEMWAVIKWHQRSHHYLDGDSGPSEFGFNMPTEVPDIAAMISRHTYFAGPQIQRVGTD